MIADGIVAIESDRFMNGERSRRIVPYRIFHLAQAAQFLGNGDVERIDQLGERLPRTVRSVLPEFAYLIAVATS